MEQEIDLRPYIRAVLQRWRLIAAIGFATVAVAIALTLILPTSYTARADVLILATRLQLQFDPRFITDDNSQFTNPAARREALVALAANGALEERVAAGLAPEILGPNYRTGDLRERITVSPVGDLMRISASDPDPDHARALVDAWALNYVRLVNEVYAKDETTTEEIRRQLGEAQQRYTAAQQELEDFLGASDLVRIEQQTQNIQALLDGSRKANQALYTQYLSRTHELDLVVNDAQTLRRQIATTPGGGLADSLAALALRARLAGGQQLPIDLRFDEPGALAQGGGASVEDLDALISVVQQRRGELLEAAQQLAQAMANGGESTVGLTPALRAAYERELTTLRQQFEQERARQNFLEQQRNVALDSLSILQRKLDEQLVALGSSQADVRFVGVAVEPPRSGLARMVIAAGLALAVGLFLGVVAAIALALIRPSPAGAPSPSPGDRPIDRPTVS